MYLFFSIRTVPAQVLWPALLLCISFQAAAQPNNSTTSDQLEDLLGLNTEQPGYDEEDLATLQALVSSPIDLNHCTASELVQIPFLDDAHAALILAHRKNQGLYETVSQLAQIITLPANEMKLLTLVLKVNPVNEVAPSNKTPAKLDIIQGYSRQFDLTAGYHLDFDEGGFAGSPVGLYTRINADFGDHLNLKLAMEKDAGERFAWQPDQAITGFDHVTGGLEFRGSRLIRNLAIGDYKLHLGQGLLFWSNTTRGKGSQPIQDPVKRNAGFRTTASREENAFLRGGAMMLQFTPAIRAGGFYSNRSLDATLKPINDSKQLAIGARQSSGLHRTILERTRKDAFQERIWGGMLRYQSSLSEISLNGYQSRYSHPYVQGDKSSDLFDFSGQSLSGIGLAASFDLGALQAITEYARSIPGGFAALAGLQWHMHPDFITHVQWRRFSNTYYTFHGNAFGEQNTRLQNESGLYVAGKFTPHPYWAVSFFVDFYQHPWLRTNISRPSEGLEYFGQTVFKPRSWLQIQLQYRHKLYERNTGFFTDTGRLLNTTTRATRNAVRFVFDIQFSSHFRSRSRFDIRQETTNPGRFKGALSVQDIYWTPGSGALLQIRLAMFNSDGGGATMYAYENDVRHRFTIKSFSGTGTRNFILLRKRVGTLFALEAKYGITRYGRTTSKGAGPDSFSGTLVRELNLQILLHV